MPETFYIRYQISLIKVLTSKSLWTKTFIPESRYLVLFDRINTLIDLLFVGIDRDYYLILNAIRFGPNDPDFYETRIRSNRLVVDQFIHVLCHCASLSNKFNLFEKFIRDYGTSSLSKKYLKQCNNDIQNLPIQMHKLYFDLYVVLPEDERHSLGNNSVFFEILSKYYLVSSINWEDVTLNIEFQAPTELIDSGFPESVSTNEEFLNVQDLLSYLLCTPWKIKFLNDSIFCEFLSRYSEYLEDDEFSINGENLKLISNSAYLRHFIRDNFSGFITQKPLFIADLDEPFKVVDENVVSLKDLVRISASNDEILVHFKTNEQLQRLDILSGRSLSEMIDPDFGYFKYRHVYQYLPSTDPEFFKDLPDNIRILTLIDSD